MSGNWLDKGISWVSPKTGLSRMQARKGMKLLASSGGYEGARRNRHNENWKAKSGSADADAIYDIPVLRDRARDVLRNNPFASKGVEAIVSHVVSTGMQPRSKDAGWNQLWAEWCEVCDADGRDDFAGIQALVLRTVVESGECLVRLRTRKIEDRLPVPLQLQVLEPDFIDDRKNARLNNGGFISNGIEFDAVGRRVAYWLFPDHPGALRELRSKGRTSQRIEAEDIIHVFRRERAGQTRGASWLSNVLLRLKYLSDYDEAELLRKRLEACFGIFIKNTDEVGSIGSVKEDSQEGRLEEIRPAMIHYLRGNEDVSFSAPNANDGYEKYSIIQLRAVSAGLRVPYELLSGDLSNTSYSSWRGGSLSFRSECDTNRWRVMKPQFGDPIVRRFNMLSEIQYPGRFSKETKKWAAPRYPWVDPLKDITALSMEVRNGFISLSEAISSQGYDPDELLNEIAADNKKLDDLGITLDSDARRTTQSGTAQNVLEEHLKSE